MEASSEVPPRGATVLIEGGSLWSIWSIERCRWRNEGPLCPTQRSSERKTRFSRRSPTCFFSSLQRTSGPQNGSKH